MSLLFPWKFKECNKATSDKRHTCIIEVHVKYVRRIHLKLTPTVDFIQFQFYLCVWRSSMKSSTKWQFFEIDYSITLNTRKRHTFKNGSIARLFGFCKQKTCLLEMVYESMYVCICIYLDSTAFIIFMQMACVRAPFHSLGSTVCMFAQKLSDACRRSIIENLR